jgi:hypothetical protein
MDHTPMQRNPDGPWTPAVPISPRGLVAKVEFWLRDHGRLPRLADHLARWDERKLG